MMAVNSPTLFVGLMSVPKISPIEISWFTRTDSFYSEFWASKIPAPPYLIPYSLYMDEPSV
jgi:hypothetical protein